MPIYCGNNSLHPSLQDPNTTVGTRFKCMKKGIGAGMNMDIDPDYLQPYAPIDERSIYCGKAEQLPEGYDYMGNLPMCLQRGIGIGKRKRAQIQTGGYNNSIPPKISIIRLMFVLCVLLLSILFIVYFIRMIMNRGKVKEKDKINEKTEKYSDT